MIRNASTPFGISDPSRPNVAATLWRTASDQKNRRSYFETTRSPSIFWVDLAVIAFAEGRPARRRSLTGGEAYAGEASAPLQDARPFTLLEATPGTEPRAGGLRRALLSTGAGAGTPGRMVRGRPGKLVGIRGQGATAGPGFRAFAAGPSVRPWRNFSEIGLERET
ncbi:hypothetical protein [Tautonia sociabilis]|uniref:Uncharacterized protein n=1 Tax=Tautonia sociabilis TaxID=2080755 RepID=A0A432MDM9_9BACT|nr:hypothetical protein [Tautonia sociabilis]RUL82936.1 hypothetical protein TsocGM_23055 [Tautonia sociabilis]